MAHSQRANRKRIQPRGHIYAICNLHYNTTNNTLLEVKLYFSQKLLFIKMHKFIPKFMEYLFIMEISLF